MLRRGMMSKCVNCGNEITDGYNFCTNCGTKVGMVYNQQTGQDKILNPNSQSGNPIYAQYSYVRQQPCPVQFTGLVSCPGREIVGLLFGIGALIIGGGDRYKWISYFSQIYNRIKVLQWVLVWPVFR